MRRVLPLTAIVVTFLLPPPLGAKAAPSYRSAQKAYRSLMASPAKKKFRDNWLKVIGMFEAVAKKAPKGADAPRALFSMGMLYSDLYNHSLLRDDLERSLKAYGDMMKRYPRSPLADDAQFEIGEIYRTKLGDKAAAYEAYSGVVTRFPKGDKAGNSRYWTEALKEFKPQPPDNGKKDARAAKTPEKKAVVRAINYWTNPDLTRVSIELSREAANSYQLLKAEPEKGRHPRIFVDISQAVLPKGLTGPIPIKDGLLTQVRSSQFDDKTVRVVLDIDSIDDYQVFNFTNPYRVIVDVKGEPRLPAEVMKEDEEQAQEKQEEQGQAHIISPARETGEETKEYVPGPEEGPVTAEAKDLSLYRQLGLGVKKIVIDPGHGGEDAGAVGKRGLREKDAVLRIAERLRDKIRKELNVDVVMTRDNDTFIPLEGRTGIAMKERGDIFVSIHANSARNRTARGVTTYVLHHASDMEARAVAARENAVSTQSLSELQNLYPKIIKPENYKESLKLARDVQASLIDLLRPRYSKVKSIGVKEGPFYVLMNAGKPAILVETSFISNPDEEKRLADEGYQEEIAEGIMKGIRKYMKEIKVAAL